MLCSKCEKIYERYLEGIYIPLVPGNGPLAEFDGTQVQDNVFHFVVYILWLKQQSDSFEKYLTVRKERYELWRESVYKLWRL